MSGGFSAGAVCQGRSGAGARCDRDALPHGADPVLHQDLEPGLQ